MSDNSKTPLTREQIEAGIASLAKGQGYYGRLQQGIADASEEVRDEFWGEVLSHDFTDMVEFVLFLES